MKPRRQSRHEPRCPKPIALNEAQLTLVLNAASALDPETRSNYLQQLADELLCQQGFNTADVDRAARKVLLRLSVGVAE